MRIAHVSDCYLPRLGGIERQVHDLAARQLAVGHDVEVVTSVPYSSATVDDVLVHRPARLRERGPGSISYSASAAGRDTVLDGKFDVVHLHASTWSPLTYLTAAATVRANTPTVMTVHSMWSYASPLFGLADTAVGWSHWPIAWSAVSSTAAGPMQRVLGSAAQVAVLPNGVDTAAWTTAGTSRLPSRVVIASVGRLAERKRPRQLLRMLRQARALVPAEIALEAVIIGDGPLRSSLQRYLNRHDMTRWARLAGAADHESIRAIYRDVDFYVAPATLESFGIAALEARCAGLPIVAHAGSGVADFVRHDIEGLLARDDRQMTAMIAQLATTPSLRDRIRHNNATTKPASGWDDVIDKCDRLYESAELLMSRRNRPRHHRRART